MITETKLPNQVFRIEGPEQGPSVAIFAGVHGNERVGVMALDALKSTLQIRRGTLYLVYANPPAIAKNVRMINKNLNRCFFAENSGTTYEDERARDLMKLLDECIALLDIHAYPDTEGDPFTICEDNSLDLATKLEPPIVSTNWTNAEPGGTDAYMYLSGKIGLCVECGHINEPEQYLALTHTVIGQFLTYFDMAIAPAAYSSDQKRLIRAKRGFIRTSNDFWLDEGLHTFNALRPGHVYARHDGEEFVAEPGECIIFPNANPLLGTEAFVIGHELPITQEMLVPYRPMSAQ